jgi:uncharacterized LabA/DUF88 family protein
VIKRRESGWLDCNGYTVVSKATKEFIDASGRRKIKGNMHVELAVEAMELAEHVDEIVLFSGHSDSARWSKRCSAACPRHRGLDDFETAANDRR